MVKFFGPFVIKNGLLQGIALTDEVKAQVQGGEVAMWSEQVSLF